MAYKALVFEYAQLLATLRALAAAGSTEVDPQLPGVLAAETRNPDGSSRWTLTGIGRLMLSTLDAQSALIDAANDRGLADERVRQLRKANASAAEIKKALDELEQARERFRKASAALDALAAVVPLPPNYRPIGGMFPGRQRVRAWQNRVFAFAAANTPMPTPPARRRPRI